MANAQIISIGTELITGLTVDTNSAYLSEQLAGMGIAAEKHVTVPDELEAIAGAIREATALCKLVLITGGIGPTADDLTREALASVLEVPLQLRQDCLDQIAAFFETRGRPMNQANRVQAMIPEGAEAIENTCGTAPGIFATVASAQVYVMPGVPVEMKTMFARSIAPHLEELMSGRVIAHRILRCFGAGESDIGAAIQPLMQRGRNPSVGTTASDGIVSIRLWADAPDSRKAAEMLSQVEGQIRAALTPLGDLVFGTGNEQLEEIVGRLLSQLGRTVATAESCTAGLLAGAITNAAGSSGYFRQGFVAYANQAKTSLLGVPAKLIAEQGAVSEPVAAEMAVRCRAITGADYALSITGIAGPDRGGSVKPVGLVYIGLAQGGSTKVSCHNFPGDRHRVRNRSVKTALNRLRLALTEEVQR